MLARVCLDVPRHAVLFLRVRILANRCASHTCRPLQAHVARPRGRIHGYEYVRCGVVLGNLGSQVCNRCPQQHEDIPRRALPTGTVFASPLGRGSGGRGDGAPNTPAARLVFTGRRPHRTMADG